MSSGLTPGPETSNDDASHRPVAATPVVTPAPAHHDPHAHRRPLRRKPNSKKARGIVMKLIRRTHLYTGLILLPWVLILGLSGFLLQNIYLIQPAHPQTTTTIPTETARKDLGFAALDINVAADQLLEQINAQTQGSRFTLVPGSPQLLGGIVAMQAAGEEGGVRESHTFELDLHTGAARVLTAPLPDPAAQPRRTTPDFVGKHVHIAALPVDDLAQKVDDVTYAAGINSDGRWTLRGRSGPEIRLKVLDESGREFHVTYDVLKGQLGGRASNELPVNDVGEAITSLHKLHVYPPEFGMRWLWRITASATALTMVFWGLSGLVMWWQLKPTRFIGITALVVMAVVGYVIISGTLAEMYFGGPAGRAPGKASAIPRTTPASQAPSQGEPPGLRGPSSPAS